MHVLFFSGLVKLWIKAFYYRVLWHSIISLHVIYCSVQLYIFCIIMFKPLGCVFKMRILSLLFMFGSQLQSQYISVSRMESMTDRWQDKLLCEPLICKSQHRNLYPRRNCRLSLAHSLQRGEDSFLMRESVMPYPVPERVHGCLQREEHLR